MAEVAFAFTFSVVGKQLQERLRRSGMEEVMKINKTMDDMKEFLNDADKKREGDPQLKEWVADARALGYRLQDVMDEFETSSDVPEWVRTAIEVIVGIVLGVFFANSNLISFLPILVVPLPFLLPTLLRPYQWLRQLKAIHNGTIDIRNRMRRFELEAVSRRELHGRRFAALDQARYDSRLVAMPPDETVGMDKHVESLKKLLVVAELKSGQSDVASVEQGSSSSTSDTSPPTPVVVFISGEMGTGKTTLAARFFQEFQWYFDFSGWVVASQASEDEEAFLWSILASFNEGVWEREYTTGHDELTSDQLRGEITELLSNKSYLIVLDDVRSPQTWAFAKNALPLTPGARVIGTRRDQNWVAEEDDEVIINYVLERLSVEDALALFLRKALGWQLERPDFEFRPAVLELGEELEQVGRRILGKCQGLPLSIVTVASLLSTKEPTPSQWEKVLANLGSESTVGRDAANQIILSSGYNDLPPILKRCFLYCSVFPENYDIPTKRLMRLWTAEGFIDQVPGLTPEAAAENQLRQLIERNMLQVAETNVAGEVISCSVLWLMRSFFIYLNREDRFCTVYRRRGDLPASMADVRRISVQTTDNIKSVLEESRNLRSILFFEPNPPKRTFDPATCQLSSKLRLLRVLDLQGVSSITSPPTILSSLTLLRYLSLRGTQMGNLPRPLLATMVKLETLDVRQTNVRMLPDLHGLTAMRNLLMSSSFTDKVITVPKGVMWLVELQVLAGIRLTKEIASEIAHLTQLRKLSAGKVRGEDSELVCEVVNRLTQLSSFTLKCGYGEEFVINTRKLKTLLHLSKLRLGGRFRNLLGWISPSKSLTCIYLWDTMLEDDPLSALQRLPKLTLLSLHNAYGGWRLGSVADGGFPMLKKLSIQQMQGLEAWEPLTEGAMPGLQKLFVSYCPKLRHPPEGLEKVFTLEIVQIMEMPVDFQNTLRERRGRLERGNVFRVRVIPPTRLLRSS